MANTTWYECIICGLKREGTSGNCVKCSLEMTQMPPPADGFHRCPRCGILVSNERREILGVDECPGCTPQKRPPKGAWDYPEGFHERNEGVGGLIVID